MSFDLYLGSFGPVNALRPENPGKLIWSFRKTKSPTLTRTVLIQICRKYVDYKCHLVIFVYSSSHICGDDLLDSEKFHHPDREGSLPRNIYSEISFLLFVPRPRRSPGKGVLDPPRRRNVQSQGTPSAACLHGQGWRRKGSGGCRGNSEQGPGALVRGSTGLNTK